MTEMPTVLITGAGGGLGGASARLFAARGWRVYAADLTPPTGGDGIVPVAMDVTDSESIQRVLARISAEENGTLSAVVNFAGVLELGPLVEVCEERMRRILDINVLGTYRVNKAAFDLLHRGRGRVVNISSETGWQRGIPLGGPYALTKHAIEAYSDSLRRELMFVSIPVVVVQPGPFRTGLTGAIPESLQRIIDSDSPFASMARKSAAMGAEAEAAGHDPDILATVIWRAVTSERPRRRYSVKPDPRRVLLHYLPTAVADRLIYLALR